VNLVLLGFFYNIYTGLKIKFEKVVGRYYDSIDHRLIISSSLAQRIEDIPTLDGFPWDYHEKHPIKKDIDPNETQREKYAG